MKNTTNEEWKKIGNATKKINNDIHDLIIEASKIVGTTRSAPLKRSLKHLNKFRSEAEDVMFSEGKGDTNTFYDEVL